MRAPHTPLVAVLLALPALAGGVPKVATKGPPPSKTPPACGAKILPLVVGNSWTYGAVQAPQPPDEKIGKLAPMEPKTIVITVKSIDAGKTETVVTLEEKVSTDVSKDSTK